MSAGGGSAFPFVRPVVPEESVYASSIVVSDGMALRDYFAAKAMQALLGSDRYPGVIEVNRYATMTAERAYQMAEAMLAAREVGT